MGAATKTRATMMTLPALQPPTFVIEGGERADEAGNTEAGRDRRAGNAHGAVDAAEDGRRA
ncbi:hypothetical protein HMPREF2976_08085 [Corynebacterium sp. HMSC077D10]|nr:hypothetical protein HMPREF2998_00210 [Corynebacterium sp. HMSC065A05]OFP68927.1 hypothetical protein HMPREF2976_08085 [Corynebacterium sp. HMSC077D10]